MRTQIVVTGIILTAVGALVATPALLRQASTQVTTEHEHVLLGVGEWEGTLTSFMPGAPEGPIAAHESVQAVGQFWTQARFECQFMGEPYVGAGFTGFEPATGKFIGTWIDSMSTYVATMEGELDRETDIFTMRWDSPDAATGEMVPHWSETVRTADEYTSTFYMGEGDGVKSMVITMKRQGEKEERKRGW